MNFPLVGFVFVLLHSSGPGGFYATSSTNETTVSAAATVTTTVTTAGATSTAAATVATSVVPATTSGPNNASTTSSQRPAVTCFNCTLPWAHFSSAACSTAACPSGTFCALATNSTDAWRGCSPDAAYSHVSSFCSEYAAPTLTDHVLLENFNYTLTCVCASDLCNASGAKANGDNYFVATLLAFSATHLLLTLTA